MPDGNVVRPGRPETGKSKKTFSLKSLEGAILLMVSVLFVFTTVSFLKISFFSQSTDTAGMVDLISNVAAGKGMVSPTFTTFYSVWILLVKTPELYCREAFDSLFVDANFARWHPYLISYPMAALTWLPGVDAFYVTILALAVSLTGGLAAAYWFLRGQGVAAALAALFVGAVFLFQPWAGNLVGQFYFDRLFFLPALILVFTVHERMKTGAGNWLPIVLSALVCFLISERSVIMAGAFLIAYTFLWRPAIWRSRDACILIALGLSGFVYFALYAAFVQDSKYYTSISLASVLGALHNSFDPNGHLRPQTMKLIAMVLPMVALSIFNWRGFLLTVGALLPNFLVTVGGAEKTGVTTHYHMPYLPFIVAGAAIGVVGLLDFASKVGGTRRLGRQVLIGGGIATVGAYGYYFDLTDLARPVSFTATPGNSQFAALAPLDSWPLIQIAKARQDFFQRVAAEIPPGATVSASDWAMPALIDRGIKLIDHAPVGLGQRDYVILEYPAGEPEMPIVPSFMAGEDLKTIRRCVDDRVRATYEPISEVSNPGSTFVIFKPRT